MHLITIPQIAEVVQNVAIDENEPVWFHGEPGCGKSEGMDQAVKAVDGQLIDFRLGQYDTVDFKGFPDVDRETNTTVWHMASTLPFVGNPRFDPDRIKVVFLDEADHGKDSVKGVAYQMLQERRVGEHIIMPNTYFVAAGNRPQDRGVGGKSPPPLNNRCTHYEVGPDADAWVQWASTQPRMPSELMAFLMFRKPLISTFDPKKPDPAFATPRTWEKVGRYFTNPKFGGIRFDHQGNSMTNPILDASIEGAVGTAAAAEFVGFCKVIRDMPSMQEIKESPTTVPISEKPEVRWAISVGIAGELDHTNTGQYQQYLDRMDPEFGILAWQLGIRRNEQLIGTREFIQMARTHQAIFASVNRSS